MTDFGRRGGGFLAPPIHAATERHILNSVKNMHVGESMKVMVRKRDRVSER